MSDALWHEWTPEGAQEAADAPEMDPDDERWAQAWRRAGLAALADRLADLAPDPVTDLTTWEPATEVPPAQPDGSPMPGRDLRAWVRERSEYVLLGLSFGKDSLATFHALREFWEPEQIIAYNLYAHPRLGWQRRQLRYYRDTLGCRIYFLSHRFVHRQMSLWLHQPPHHVPVCIAGRYNELEYTDIYNAIALDAEVADARPWVAQGVRAADSPLRRIVISRRGPFSPGQRVFYPIWDERKPDVVRRLRDLGVKLPVDYRVWGRTFDGLDYRFIKPLADVFPEDYDRLRDMWPLMEANFIARGEEPPRA